MKTMCCGLVGGLGFLLSAEGNCTRCGAPRAVAAPFSEPSPTQFMGPPVETLEAEALRIARMVRDGEPVLLTDAGVRTLARYVRSLHPLPVPAPAPEPVPYVKLADLPPAPPDDFPF